MKTHTDVPETRELPMLLWVDVETTGLDPKTDSILEIGMRFTDTYGTEYELPLSMTVMPDAWENISPESTHDVWENVPHMHTVNNLVADALADRHTEDCVKDRIRSYIKGCLRIADGRSTLLAGNSVHFDRRFLDEWEPGILDGVSHQHMDVTSLTRFADAIGLPVDRPETNHRVSTCLSNSIHEYRQILLAAYRMILDLQTTTQMTRELGIA